MNVTIVADASWHDQTSTAGYGFWAVSLRGRHAGGGSIKSSVTSALAAEVMAVVNALHVALKIGIAAKGDHVLVQTDCIGAIAALGGSSVVKRKKHIETRRAVDVFKGLVATNALTTEFRHVKGHSKVTDSRSRAQRHADKRARMGMKAARRAASTAQGKNA